MGIGSQIMFYVSALLAISGGIVMLFSRNTVNSAMGLLLTFLSTAGIYLSLLSPFIAMAQVFLYSGAVAVLIVFAIFLIDEQKRYELPLEGMFVKGISVISLLYIGYVLIYAFRFSQGEKAFFSDINELGRIMVNDYLLHIEALSVVLIIAIMSAILIAKRHKQ